MDNIKEFMSALKDKNISSAMDSIKSELRDRSVSAINTTRSEVAQSFKMNPVQEASGDDKAYKAFFNKTLAKYDAKSPSELSKEDSKKFYDEIDAGWEGDNEVAESKEEDEEDESKEDESKEDMDDSEEEDDDKDGK